MRRLFYSQTISVTSTKSSASVSSSPRQPCTGHTRKRPRPARPKRACGIATMPTANLRGCASGRCSRPCKTSIFYLGSFPFCVQTSADVCCSRDTGGNGAILSLSARPWRPTVTLENCMAYLYLSAICSFFFFFFLAHILYDRVAFSETHPRSQGINPSLSSPVLITLAKKHWAIFRAHFFFEMRTRRFLAEFLPQLPSCGPGCITLKR